MCAPSPPPAPDYTQAAQAQGDANLEAARAQSRMNNPNIYTPYGSQTVTWSQSAPTFDESGYNQAWQQYQNALANPARGEPIALGDGFIDGPVLPPPAAPSREQYTTPGGYTAQYQDQPTVTQTLTPEQQKIFDTNQQGQQGLADLGLNAIDKSGKIFIENLSFAGAPSVDAMDVSRLPSRAQQLDPRALPQMGRELDPGALPGMGRSLDPNALPQMDGRLDRNSLPNMGRSLDSNGLPQMEGRLDRNSLPGMGAALDRNSLPGMGRSLDQSVLPMMGRELDQNSLPGLSRSLDPNALPGMGQTLDPNRLPRMGTSFDPSILSPMADSTGTRNAVREAMLSRVNTDIGRDRDNTASTLIARGIPQGSEAWNREMDRLDRQQTDARYQAELAASTAANQQFNQDLSLRSQQMGAQGQQFAQTDANRSRSAAEQAQAYAQAQGARQLSANEQAQMFGQTAEARARAQAEQAQQFGQASENRGRFVAEQAQSFGQSAEARARAAAEQAQYFGQASENRGRAMTEQAQAFGQSGDLRSRSVAEQAQSFGQDSENRARAAMEQAQAFGQSGDIRGRALAEQAQAYGQQTGNRTLSAAEQAQMFGQQTGNRNLSTAEQAQLYSQMYGNRGQALSEEQAAQQGTTAARQQVIQELMALRQSPLNEINAFRSGSQVAPLQFQNYQPSQVAPAPIFGGMQAQAGAQQNAYNAQVAQQNAMMSGLFSLGGAAMGAPAGTFAAFSDRRLKSNVVRIGTHPLGIGIYEYDIFGRRERGVMADEVAAVRPAAVLKHSSGYQMVDYAQL